MNRIQVVSALAMSASVYVIGGCQQTAELQWDPPKQLSQERTPIYVKDLADSRSAEWGKSGGEAIGKHTFSVFAIPAGNINADSRTPVLPSYTNAIRDALIAAGYKVQSASQAPAGVPILVPELNECHFWSYTWFWPIIVQGGQVTMRLRLEQPDGPALWNKEFKAYAPGASVGASLGFDGMVRGANSKVINDIAAECSGAEFRSLVGGPKQLQVQASLQP